MWPPVLSYINFINGNDDEPCLERVGKTRRKIKNSFTLLNHKFSAKIAFRIVWAFSTTEVVSGIRQPKGIRHYVRFLATLLTTFLGVSPSCAYILAMAPLITDNVVIIALVIAETMAVRWYF